jgi:hypothetical protein
MPMQSSPSGQALAPGPTFKYDDVPVPVHPISLHPEASTMGNPVESSSSANESLTVRDNRTGKTYTIPCVVHSALSFSRS